MVNFSVDANGKVGEVFRALLQPSQVGVCILGVELPPDLGVDYDPATQALQGTPLLAGDHPLIIRYLASGDSSGTSLQEGRCVLIVNPDPKSLWKNLPSDQSDPCWKPDSASECLTGGDGRRLLAVSKRGRSHAHQGEFREDDYALATAGGWHILALADGAGSASLSRRGSQLATQAATKTLRSALADERGQRLAALAVECPLDMATSRAGLLDLASSLFGEAVQASVQAIQAEADTRQGLSKDYATTLLLAAHYKLAQGHLLMSYWVGDGAIGLYQQGESLCLLGQGDSGEFAGQTRFLDTCLVSAAESVRQRLQIEWVPDFTALLLMTDGVSDPWFETERQLASLACWDVFWGAIAPSLQSDDPAGALLDWLDFWSPGNHDDRSLALLW